MTIKVSVVVPVYNPGRHIDPLVESLLRQTMRPEDFEVLFVDDGSTDGTGARLDELAATVLHFRVIHIPNSGWPGRPRNVGIDAAQGEYVQLVDNDDELGDEALQRLYNYASAHHSDVVIGKEVRRNLRPAFGPLFRRNVAVATLGRDPLLALLTPHKLFRRAFLDAEGLRFPEGPRRLEDHPFVVEAYFRAAVVSILADYTCYYWVQRQDKSNAGLRPIVWDEWYGHLRDALDVVERYTESEGLRDRLLVHWYVTKGLRLLGSRLATRSDEDGRALFDALRTLTVERFPPRMDAYVHGVTRVRSVLLRTGDYDALRRLADVERGLQLVQRLEAVEWVGDELRVTVTAWLAYADGSPVTAEAEADRLYWQLPAALGDLVPRDVLDFTTELPRTRVEVVVRHRTTHDTWLVPGEAEQLPPQQDGTRLVGGRYSATLTPSTVEAGRPLSKAAWDVDVQVRGCGWAMRRPLRVAADDAHFRGPLPALVGRQTVTPYRTKSGNLAVDVDQAMSSLVKTAPVDRTGVTLEPSAEGVTVGLPMPGLRVAPDAQPAARLRLHPVDGRGEPVSVDVTVGGSGIGALLTAVLPAAGGDESLGAGADRWRLDLELPDRAAPLGLMLRRQPRSVAIVTDSGQELAVLAQPRRPGRPVRDVPSVGSVLRRATGHLRRLTGQSSR